MKCKTHGCTGERVWGLLCDACDRAAHLTYVSPEKALELREEAADERRAERFNERAARSW